MVWYQKFEYAVGHWLQKTAEHVFGSVLCSPGCFSLFRGAALMDDNVMKRYTTKATEASHYIQYDQGKSLLLDNTHSKNRAACLCSPLSSTVPPSALTGEDRWLCTLLLQQGWRVEYNAASDAYTNAPRTSRSSITSGGAGGPPPWPTPSICWAQGL